MAPNIAVIGFGYWGKNLVRNFHQLGALRAICDVDRSRAEATRSNYPDVDFYHHIDQCLTNDTIDAVVIASPAVTHHEVAKAALLAGKDVFVEKPLALNVSDGKELIDLAANQQRMLMVGHILQYHPAIHKLKELIHRGELGRIEYFYSNRLNIGKFRTEENILWSFAPHDVSVMLSLLNEKPTAVVCQGGNYLNGNIADVTISQFTFANGARAHIFVSWLHPFKEQRLVVIGSEKMAVFDDTAENKLLVYPHEVKWIDRIPTAMKADAVVIPVADDEPLRLECQHFLDCITNRQRPLTDGHEGLRVLEVLTESERQLQPIQQPGNSDKPPSYFAHPTSCIDAGATIGDGTNVWHYSHVMSQAQIGNACTIGQNCLIADDVSIGNNVKLQNNVSVYTGTEIEDDVFLGPSCVLTNVSNPRSQVNRQALYEKTTIRRGATIGANATIVCGVTIGAYAFIGAGAVVTRDVPSYALVMGNPARQQGWMSRHGHRLSEPDANGTMVCPESGLRYRFSIPDSLRCLDIDDNSPLPDHLATGQGLYGNFHTGTRPSQNNNK